MKQHLDLIRQAPDLSAYQKVLLMTHGTVTHLLELFAGESISVQKIEQTVTNEGHKELAVLPEEPVLKRIVLLRGDQKCYLYAESHFVLTRLPPAIREALVASNKPIGRLWRENKMETYREVIAYHREKAPCSPNTSL